MIGSRLAILPSQPPNWTATEPANMALGVRRVCRKEQNSLRPLFWVNGIRSEWTLTHHNACLILAFQIPDTEIYCIERAVWNIATVSYASPDYSSIKEIDRNKVSHERDGARCEAE